MPGKGFNKQVLGVDGCRGGWVACVLHGHAPLSLSLYATIQQLWDAHRDASLVMIDIPIGLAGKDLLVRECDRLARRMLGKKGSSVFTPVCREALHAHDYSTACSIQERITGKKISIQSWNITPKIREADRLMLASPSARNAFRETHPEINFMQLHNGPMLAAKRSSAGREARLQLLAGFIENAATMYRDALHQYPRKMVQPDDLLDAMVNMVAGMKGKDAIRSLPDPPQKDEEGLAAALWY